MQPIQQATYLLTYGLYHGFHSYFYLVGIQNQNNELQQNQLRLAQKLNRMKELEGENLRLRSILGLVDRTPFFQFAAEVIARDATSLFKSIRINKGGRDGVDRGMAVINGEGVVGHVLRTYPGFADVSLVTDPNTAVDAINQRSRVRGIVVGWEGSKAQMKYVLRSDDIKPGDIIVTSGMGGFYPKGLPIGTVVRTDRVKYDITQFVEIAPFVNFSKLEEVLLLRKPSEKELDSNKPQTENIIQPSLPSSAPPTSLPPLPPGEDE